MNQEEDKKNILSKEIFDKFPFFDVGEFVMRELKETDAIEYFIYTNNQNVSNYLSDDLVPQSIQQANLEIKYWMNLFRYKRSFFWGIAQKNNDKLVGTIGFNYMNIHARKSEINYDLAKEKWSQGIMKKCLCEVLKFSKEIGIIRIQATVIESNIRSIKLLESLGFAQEGVLEKYELIKGKRHNSKIYSKIFHENC